MPRTPLRGLLERSPLRTRKNFTPKGGFSQSENPPFGVKPVGFRGFFGEPLNGARGIVSQTFPRTPAQCIFAPNIQWHYVRTLQVG